MRISDWSSDVCSSDLLQVRPGLHISGTHFIGYLSHGCDPNCRLDMERFELVARRDIAPGETLTVDYAATEDVLFRQFACRCAAPTCRGWITGRAEEINADGRRALAGGRKPKRLCGPTARAGGRGREEAG